MELSKNALDAITLCFCKYFNDGGDVRSCSTCPLSRIKVPGDYTSICSLYYSNDPAERNALLDACKKHGNYAIFKSLPQEYRVFLKDGAQVV